MASGLPLSTPLRMLSFAGVYGGYRTLASPRKLLRSRTAFRWVKASKLKAPWYAPMPLSPTPPNGRCGFVSCNANSSESKQQSTAIQEHFLQ